tara:strand:+ start:3321 stop:4448 length:1128 start_codon:yes stop_codon:yes gene_type:complete
MLQIKYDIGQSLKDCPPSSLYEEGITFHKRIVTSIKNIEMSNRTQVRKDLVVVSNVTKIEESYQTKGYDYKETPIIVIKNPNFKPGSNNKYEKCEFLVISGHNRLSALLNLGCTTVLVDLVSFDSVIKMLSTSNKLNSNRSPFSDNTDGDYLYSIEEAYKKRDDAGKPIVDATNDQDVLSFLKESGVYSDQKRRNILEQLRRKVSSHGAFMRPMNASIAKIMAKDLKLPYDGDSNAKNVMGLGLIVGSKSWRSVMYQSESIMMSFPDKPIDVYAFIENPNPMSLSVQRKDWYDKYNSNLTERYYNFFAARLSISVIEVKKRVKKAPWNFVGFLPQNENTEFGVVDIYGHPVSVPDRTNEFKDSDPSVANILKFSG